MKVSIIIPVYNVSKYLLRCLDSVITQTYQDIECILVDDCGKDDSANIAEEFINKYKRGYNNWHGNRINKVLQGKLDTYLKENGITLEKINYIERELKLDLSSYKSRIKLNHPKYFNPKDLIY